MRRRRPVLLLSLLALSSCHSANQTPLPDMAALEGNFAIHTFEQWIASSDTVFVGDLVEVVDEEPFTTDSGRRLQELRFRVDDPRKGTSVPGMTVAAVHGVDFDHAKIRRAEIGTTFLVVGFTVRNVLSEARDRVFPEILGLNAFATYQRISFGGNALGIRLVSPFAQQIAGYEGDRKIVAQRIQDGRPVRAVDATDWDDLLSRIADPAQDIDDHLGIHELRHFAPIGPTEHEIPSRDNLEEEERLIEEEFKRGRATPNPGAGPED